MRNSTALNSVGMSKASATVLNGVEMDALLMFGAIVLGVGIGTLLIPVVGLMVYKYLRWIESKF